MWKTLDINVVNGELLFEEDRERDETIEEWRQRFAEPNTTGWAIVMDSKDFILLRYASTVFPRICVIYRQKGEPTS